MNNDPTPSSMWRQSTSPADDHHDARHQTTGPSEEQRRPRDSAVRSSRHVRQGRKSRKVNPGFLKKLQFMTHLLQNLDTLVVLQLSALYYMECSIFRLAIRAYPHYVYLSPKPEGDTLTVEAVRTQVVSVFLPNLICMVLHIFTNLPTGGEAQRGYLHGGVLVDFIGQKPPTSKFSLLAFDLVILAVQCFMLAMHSERERLRFIVRPIRTRASRQNTDRPEPATIQDHDAEERGIYREDPNPNLGGDDGIQMQTLNRPAVAETRDGRIARQPRGHSSSDSSSTRTHLSDILSSGNGILGEFHILHTIRNATTDYETLAAHSLQSIGYTVRMTQITAMRRLEGNQRR